MADDTPSDDFGPITEEAEITKWRLGRIAHFSKKIAEYLELKGGKQEIFKSLKDGSITPIWILQEASPGGFDKAIAEFKEAIVTEASKL